MPVGVVYAGTKSDVGVTRDACLFVSIFVLSSQGLSTWACYTETYPDFGRSSDGTVVTPARQTGNGRGNVRVVETVEAEEDEVINGDGRVTEVSDTIAVYHRTCVALRVLYNVYYITSHCVYCITCIILRSALF